MGARALSGREIRGLINVSLILAETPEWLTELTGIVLPSDQFTEKYKWLSDTPAMRKWLGERQARTLSDLGIDVINETFENTLDIEKRAMLYEKLGQHRLRIAEQASRFVTHWTKLVTDVLVNNPICYDGQNFFDTDHLEGDSGSQSNALTTAGTPTIVETKDAILASIKQLRKLKDGAGEPINENISKIRVLVPPDMEAVTIAAIFGDTISIGSGAAATNELTKVRLTADYAVNPRLTAVKTFYVYVASTTIPTVIRQQMTVDGGMGPNFSSLEEGSDHAHKTGRYQFGIDCDRGVAPGRWQQIIRYVFS